MDRKIRVRIPPSPTGNLHLGNGYTAFFNYLFARRYQGELILRIEDTDKERSKKEYEENVISSLTWLGIKWDEGPYRQSERLGSYKTAIDKLLEAGHAYYCFCTQEELDAEKKHQQADKLPLVYSGKCRKLSKEDIKVYIGQGKKFVVRLKVPENRGVVEFNDMLHGRITFESNLIGDIVLTRSSGMPLYNFAVVVDDIDMNITHVLRGDDHLSNTPKQILIFEALNAEIPQFVHWPMVLNPDRIGKLSKRANATSVDDYKKMGFLSEALINYFSLLGWTMSDDKEIMSLAEMVEAFDIKKMRLSGAAFDLTKLEWLNGEYIRMLSDADLTKRLQEFLVDHPSKDKIEPLVPLVKERIKTLSEFVPLTNFIFQKPEYDISVFEKTKVPNIMETLISIKDRLESLPKPWDAKYFETAFRDLAQELNIPAANIFQLIRVAVSGQLVTPPLFESITILGEDETINRVTDVIIRFEKF